MAERSIELEIGELVLRTRSLAKRSINEQETKAALIEPMLAALGWDVRDPRSVRREFRGSAMASPVDYALMLGDHPAAVVEAKALGVDLSDKRWLNQVVGYAAVSGAAFCLLTDGDQYLCYSLTAPVPADQKLFWGLQLSDTEDDASEVVELLTLASRRSLDDGWAMLAWERFSARKRARAALVDLLGAPGPMGDLVAARLKGIPRLELDAALVQIARSIPPVDVDVAGIVPVASDVGNGSPGVGAAAELTEMLRIRGLPAPVALRAAYLGHELAAEITAEGQVRTGGSSYGSPSGAARAAMAAVGRIRQSCNGWDFWCFAAGPHAGQTLNDLRRTQ